MSEQPGTAVEKYAAIVERMGLPIEGDVVELSKEPVGGLMGWHELAVTVRHIGQGVGYNYPQLAKSLCQHLGFALGRLSELESQLAAAEARATGLQTELAAVREQLRPGSPTERAPTVWAYEQVSAALENHKQQFGQLRGQVTSILEDFAAGCVTVKMEPGVKTTPYWLGVNAERISNLQWAELKCKELGIAWPIKPIPYKGDLPSEPAAPTLVGDETPAPPKEAEKAIKAAQAHMFAALGVRLTPYNEVERNRYEGFLAGYAAKTQPYAAASLVAEKGPAA